MPNHPASDLSVAFVQEGLDVCVIPEHGRRASILTLVRIRRHVRAIRKTSCTKQVDHARFHVASNPKTLSRYIVCIAKKHAVVGGNMANKLWLEMSRDVEHGGDGWEFGVCLWSPSEKESGAKWPFWSSLLEVQAGDVVLHLRGKDKRAAFVGWSTADSNGYETDRRPPKPKKWGFAKTFNRVPLRDYTALVSPIPLRHVFSEQDQKLREYFQNNSSRPTKTRMHLFYVIQSNRLQCFNGGYLSEVDHVLRGILLGNALESGTEATHTPVPPQLSTGQQPRQVVARIGQSQFSDAVKANYGYRCCFPGCSVDDERFLVGSHIARWADAPELRGSIANGLCLCLIHDKAFEMGMFTLTEAYTVYLNPQKTSRWASVTLSANLETPIRSAPLMPSIAALEYHWRRVGCDPRDKKPSCAASSLTELESAENA